MEHKKYRDFFLYKLFANANDFDNEYKRVIEEHGKSREIEVEFYKAAFESVINNIKKEIPIDYDRIQNGYREFIILLRQDEIEVTELVIEKSKFTSNDFSANYKPYNPNTKYGRKKGREQAQRNYENGSEEYRKEIDNIKIVVWVIIIVIAIFFFIIKAKLK
jgi:hypothetical protein